MVDRNPAFASTNRIAQDVKSTSPAQSRPNNDFVIPSEVEESLPRCAMGRDLSTTQRLATLSLLLRSGMTGCRGVRMRLTVGQPLVT